MFGPKPTPVSPQSYWIQWRPGCYLPDGMYFVQEDNGRMMKLMRVGCPCEMWVPLESVFVMVHGDPIATKMFDPEPKKDTFNIVAKLAEDVVDYYDQADTNNVISEEKSAPVSPRGQLLAGAVNKLRKALVEAGYKPILTERK
jgi:hypothetical protein